MRQVRQAGGRVAFDANLRLKLWTLDEARAGIAQAMAAATSSCPASTTSRRSTAWPIPTPSSTGATPPARAPWSSSSAPTAACASEGGRRERIAAHRVQAVDATGAGDCFSGNLLARLARGDDLFTAARYANAAAALAVQGWGAVAPLPTPDQVRSLL
jgi:2-dehydro-3-deoxygluconokinase